MRSIICATSDAELSACVFIFNGSMTPAAHESTTFPLKTSTPNHFWFFLSCAAFSSTRMFIGSMPAFSARVRGMTSKAAANASTASCSLPDKPSAYLRSPFATSISGAPAPATTLPLIKAAATSPIASVIALFASSTTCSVPPLTSTVTAFGFLQPITNVISSLPIFFSSIMPAAPRSFELKSLRDVTILAPVALASASMSLFFTLLAA